MNIPYHRRAHRLWLLVAPLVLACCLTSVLAQVLPLGSPAPDFRLPGIDGQTYALRDFDRQPVLVVAFICNHCPISQLYEERLKAFVADYAPRGVGFVAISPNDERAIRLNELGYTDVSDSFEEMKIRARHRAFNFPYLYAGDREDIGRAYGPTSTPHMFVFDRERKLRYVGRVDDSEKEKEVRTNNLRDAVDALLAGLPVAVSQTRAFGCSIKWPEKRESVENYLRKLAAVPVGVEQIDANGLRRLRANDSGKVRLVNFWATWCGPCITEFPELVAIDRMVRHRAFEFVSVAVQGPDEQREVLRFLEQQQASNQNYLLARGNKYDLIETFDSAWNGSLPYTVVIDESGDIVYRHAGSIDPLELKRAILKHVRFERPRPRID